MSSAVNIIPIAKLKTSSQQPPTRLAAAMLLAIVVLTASYATAGDLQIKIPKRTKPTPVQQLNQEGVKALSKNDVPSAKRAFYKAYMLDPKNPFTLNNLGYALEKEGELEQAVRYYSLAASSASDEKIVVALNRSWRGRSISEVAEINAQAARRELSTEGTSEAKVARLNLRGVSALNRNQRAQARQYFQEAYRLDPGNAFSLNNMGY